MADAQLGFLTIMAWPEGWTGERAIEALAACAGMAPIDARQVIAKPTPMIASRDDAVVAKAIAADLRRLGVDAFAPTEAHFDAVPQAVLARSLDPAVGAPEPLYLAQPWSGEACPLFARRIRFIVRGDQRREEKHKVVEQRYVPMTHGLHVNVEHTETTTHLNHLVDIFTNDGRRFRVDGQKFNFGVLGPERGHSDNDNTARLVLRLAEESPKAVIDTGYAGFRPPGPVAQWAVRRGLRQPSGARRSEQPLFDFYSAWAFLCFARARQRA